MVIYLRINTSVRILWLNTTVHSREECKECRGCTSWGSREQCSAIRLPWTAELLWSLPLVKNERNFLSLYFMPTRPAFPGMSTQQEWHLMITQHMHLTHQHLTCMKHSTSNCQSWSAITQVMFSNNCSLPSCQGRLQSSWLTISWPLKNANHFCFSSSCFPTPRAQTAQNLGKWNEQITKNKWTML